MLTDDTINLLKECNAGIKTGVNSIDAVYDSVSDDNFRNMLLDCKEEHQRLGSETHTLLNKYHDSGKEPSPMAKGMSWFRTNIALSMNETDNTVADIVTDGCNMGVKSLNKYLNKYNDADETSKDITNRLINIEEKLAVDIRPYL